MNDEQQVWQRKTRVVRRAAYTPPQLKEFGYVAALTQAGTGPMAELMANGMSSMSTMQRL